MQSFHALLPDPVDVDVSLADSLPQAEAMLPQQRRVSRSERAVILVVLARPGRHSQGLSLWPDGVLVHGHGEGLLELLDTILDELLVQFLPILLVEWPHLIQSIIGE